MNDHFARLRRSGNTVVNMPVVDSYARTHLKLDHILEVHYLPYGANDNEIRFLEINTKETKLLNLSVFNAFCMFVFDVIVEDWEKIKEGTLSLPDGWSFRNEKVYRKKSLQDQSFFDMLGAM